MKLRGVYWIHPVRPSVRPSVRSFRRISIFWYMYHLGQDLGRDWIWVSYIILYAHNGRSCHFLGIIEVNFSVKGFKRGVFRDLMETHDISPGVAEFEYLYFPWIFYPFLNESVFSLMSVLCQDDNLNCFHWISMIFGINVVCVKILDGIEYQHHTPLNMRIMANHVTSVFWHFWRHYFQLEPSNLVCSDTLGARVI